MSVNAEHQWFNGLVAGARWGMAASFEWVEQNKNEIDPTVGALRKAYEVYGQEELDKEESSGFVRGWIKGVVRAVETRWKYETDDMPARIEMNVVNDETDEGFVLELSSDGTVRLV